MDGRAIDKNLQVAKEKLRTKGKDTLEKTKSSMNELKGKVVNQLKEKKTSALKSMIKTGIKVTQKQMDALKKAEKKTK